MPETKRERTLNLAVQCGVLKRTPNGSMPAARFSIDEVERLVNLARAAGMREAAKICQGLSPRVSTEKHGSLTREEHCAYAILKAAEKERDGN